MDVDAVARTRITPVSILPGRARWQVHAARVDDLFYRDIEARLSGDPEVSRASVSALTGRALLFFDRRLPISQVEEKVRRAVEEASATPRRAARTRIQHFLPARALRRGAWLGLATVVTGLLRVFLMGAGVAALASGTSVVVLGIRMGGTSLFIAAGVASGVLFAVELYLRYRGQITLYRAGREAQHRARLRLFDHVMQMPMDKYGRVPPAEHAHLLLDEVHELERTIDAAARLWLDALQAIVSLAVLAVLAPQTAMLTGVVVGGILLWTALTLPKIRGRFVPAREAAAKLDGRLSASVSGMPTLRAFGAEDQEKARIDVLSRDLRDAIGAEVPALVGWPLALEGAVWLGTGMVALWSVDRLREAPGALVTEVALASRILGVVAGTGPSIADLSKGLVSARRIEEALSDGSISLDVGPDRAEAPEGASRRTSTFGPEVRFEEVQFSYATGTLALAGTSLVLEAGRTTAVVGESGSGKSTLLALLLGFYSPSSGQIRIDGVDMRDLPPIWARSNVSVVTQDIHLFPMSVRDNIALGRPRATREEVEEAARRARAHRFIAQLPDGYDTVLGDRGTTLSGGERQRLAIARALLRDAPILVLDEATSQLDAETERDVREALAEVARGRTSLVIAHRLSAVWEADRLYVLSQGRVIESGTPRQLAAGQGPFRRLADASRTSV